jgi:hypothetical protein
MRIGVGGGLGGRDGLLQVPLNMAASPDVYGLFVPWLFIKIPEDSTMAVINSPALVITELHDG